MTSLQKWMMTSAILFVLGLPLLIYLFISSDQPPKIENAIVGTLIMAATAIGAPARIFGPQIREERAAQEKKLRDTFK